MNEIECPYCHHEFTNDIEGEEYEENIAHERECPNCGKMFVFYTYISISFESHKADCLNGKNHSLKLSTTFPNFMSRMHCVNCSYSRSATDEELIIKYPNAIKEREKYIK